MSPPRTDAVAAWREARAKFLTALDGEVDGESEEDRARRLLGDAMHAMWCAETLAAEVERLREALRRYGRHDTSCPASLAANIDCKRAMRTCTCGLSAALGER